MDRRDKAFELIDLKGRGLEIGGSHSPLLPKSSGVRIETVDHASKSELVDKYRGIGISEDQLANIADVDYVWTQGALADAVGEPGAFDFIICSHVIEHMVDLIGFLQSCETLLRDGGRLSLLVPDKRYCFDLFQPLTTVGTAVNGHLSGARFHPYGTALDYFAYATERDPGRIAWDSVTTTPLSLTFGDMTNLNEEVARARDQKEYVDVHRWRFTPTSFRLLLQDLRDLGYHKLVEVGGHDTAGSEFFITLTRSEAAPARLDRMASLIQIEEELRAGMEPVVPAADLHAAKAASAAAEVAAAEAVAAEVAAAEVAAAESARLNAALSESDAKAEHLRFALQESERQRKACAETLSGVLASRSWRATRPLRAILRH